eukprot:4489409-Alexandrium_andersonii.AAC.1
MSWSRPWWPVGLGAPRAGAPQDRQRTGSSGSPSGRGRRAGEQAKGSIERAGKQLKGLIRALMLTPQ